MISDTLFEAADQIRGYLEIYPDVYAEIRNEIDDVTSSMDTLRQTLDAPLRK